MYLGVLGYYITCFYALVGPDYMHKLFCNIFTNCCCNQLLTNFYLDPPIISLFYLPIITHLITVCKIFCKKVCTSGIFLLVCILSSFFYHSLVYLKSKQQAINGGNPNKKTKQNKTKQKNEMKSRFGRCWCGRERERERERRGK